MVDMVMDADVLFPRDFLRRLLASPAPSALLLDRGFADTGEEVKLYTRGDRVIALGKKVVPEAWDAVGEGVGFFKCGAEAGPHFVRYLERVIEESRGMNEYEGEMIRVTGKS
jgi:choline kinase